MNLLDYVLASVPLSPDESLTERGEGHFLQLMKSAHSSLLKVITTLSVRVKAEVMLITNYILLPEHHRDTVK